MSTFIGYQMHDLLRELGILPANVVTERVRVVARKGERCRVLYTSPGATGALMDNEIDLEWEPLLKALIAVGVLGHPTYCRAFSIDAPNDKPCTITYEYFADKEPMFAGLRAATIARDAGDALVR